MPGPQVVDLLLANPQVLLRVNGHSHPTAGVDGLRGAACDRNVELLLPVPAGLVL